MSSGIARPPSRIGKPKNIPTSIPENSKTPQTPKTPLEPSQKAALSDLSQSKSSIQFVIGDRVEIPGGKQGQLVFLDETKFAKGEWAGVILDGPFGKNDGTVDGIAYFKCAAGHGVFLRPSKLIRVDSTAETPGRFARQSSKPTKEQPESIATKSVPLEASHGRTTPRPHTPGPVAMRPKSVINIAHDVKVGDTVYVNGVKEGKCVYVGETEFATGTWVGVLLPDKSGKNDGSVNGKRYFDCEMGYGLFSPISKISKEMRPPSTVPKQRPASVAQEPMFNKLSIPDIQRRRGSTTAVPLQRDKLGGSSGSLSSMSSASSMNKGAFMSCAPSQPAHELLREAEVRENQLRMLVDKADKEKMELTRQLEEERRKVEDLHFRMEEESIMKGEVQSERNRYKHKFESAEAALAEYHDQLEDLRKKYYDLEFQLQEKSIDSDSGVSSLDTSEDLKEKDRLLKQLQAQMESIKGERDALQSDLRATKDIVNSMKNDSMQSSRIVEELKHKVSDKELSFNELQSKLEECSTERDYLKNQLSEASLTVSSMKDEKARLESTLAELVGSSGDTDSKLTVLNNDNKEKEALIEKLETSIRELKVQMSQMESKLQTGSSELEKQFSLAQEEHKKNINDMQQRIDELSSQLTASQEKLSQSESNLQSKALQLDKLRSEFETVSVAAAQSDEKIQKLENARKELLTTAMNGKLQLDSLKDENKKLESRILEFQSVEEDLSRAIQEKSRAEKELKACGEKLNSSESRCETLEKQMSGLNRLLSERDEQLKKLQKVSEEKSKIESEHSKTTNQYETLLSKYGEMKKELAKVSSSSKQMQELESRLKEAEEEASEYKNRNEILIEDYASLESWHEDLKAKFNLTVGLSEENVRLKNELMQSQEALMAKESSILQYKDSISKYKAELDVALKKAASLENCEKGTVSMQIRAERDSLQKQVDFLNSVIVDLQNKNTYLMSQTQDAKKSRGGGVLEVNGGGDDFITPQGSDDLEEFDSPMNPAYTRVRPFCDICDEFDLHNTEQCPNQVASSPPASYNRGNVHEERPYCDTCEMFDHWTEDCNDDQMF